MTRYHRRGSGRGLVHGGLSKGGEGVLQAPGKDFPGPGNSRGKALRAAVCYFYSMFNCPHNAGVEEGHRILSDLGTRLRA